MEYVILTTSVLLPLVGVVNWAFDPTGQFDLAGPIFNPSGAVHADFGLLGNAFVEWCQRMMSGVGLPVP
jgi:hypothetical protein